MAINEEEVKIRERLTSLETKLGFIQSLLEEIRNELKDQPTKDDFESLAGRVKELEDSQTSMAIKIGIASGFLGFIGGLIVRFLMG